MHPVRPAEDRRLPTEDVARSTPLPHAYAPAPCEPAIVQGEITRAHAMNVTAPRRARADTCMLVTALGWDGDVEDAVLAVSELVTNACRYTNAAGPELRVRLAVLDADTLLGAVQRLREHITVLIPYVERWAGYLGVDGSSSSECREVIERAGNAAAAGSSQGRLSAQDVYWLAGAVNGLLVQAVCAQDAGLLVGEPVWEVSGNVSAGPSARSAGSPGSPVVPAEAAGRSAARGEVVLPSAGRLGYLSRRRGGAAGRCRYVADGDGCDRHPPV
ncbi:DUF6415 family natural product biosynthesis protein [Streptomyces sp. NPDC102274]|uniref:DUF6415 family natural product biosynthesis protein n=1 Tax=Streptomyces sp. NPDC102274 TaxID=3366151 RepID=UPI0037FC1553